MISILLVVLTKWQLSSTTEYFQYKNRQSGSCIFSNPDGRFSYSICENWEDQYWTLDDYDGTYFRLRNKYSNKCIFNNADGRFGVHDCLSYEDQYWSKSGIDGNYFHLKNKHSGKCLYQNSDGRFSYGSCWTFTDQYWTIIEYFHLKNRESGSCIYQNSDGRFSYGNCAEYADQYWYQDNYYSLSDGQYFRLRNRQSGSCIYQNSDGRFSYGDCAEYDDQYWFKYDMDGDYFHLKNKQSGSCMYQNSDGRFSYGNCADFADQYWLQIYEYSLSPTQHPTPYPTTSRPTIGNIDVTPNISTIQVTACDGWDYGSMSSTLRMQLKGLNGITEFFIVNSQLPLPTQGRSTIFTVQDIDVSNIAELYSVLLSVDDLSGYCIQDLSVGYIFNGSAVEYIFNSSSYFGNGIILSNQCKHSYRYISSDIPLISCIENYLELNVYKKRGIYELDIHTCIIDNAGMSINNMKNNLYVTIMGKQENQNSYINTEIVYLDNFVPDIFNFEHLGHIIAENIPLTLSTENAPVLSSSVINQKIIGIKIEAVQDQSLNVNQIYLDIDGTEIQLNSKLFDNNRILIGFISDRTNRINIVESSRITIYKDGNLQYEGNINVYAIFEGFEELYQLPFVVGYSAEPMDWYSANSECVEGYGTSLASIHSEIDSFILNGLIPQQNVGLFIGLIRLDLDGRWTWIDQSHLDFTNWESGQSRNRDEDCGELYGESNWEWNDIPCSKIKNQYFVCSSPYWYKDTNRKFEINSIHTINDIVLVSIGNNNNEDSICIDSIIINNDGNDQSAKHISDNVIGGDSGLLSLSAIIKYPVCKTEVVGMTIDYDSSVSSMIDGDSTISGLQCSNGNKLISATCSISQSFEMSKTTSFSISNEDSSTNEYSWGTSSSITTGTSSSQSSSTSNEFSFGFNQELSIGISTTVEAGVETGIFSASASVENRLDFSFGSNQQWTQSNERSNEQSLSREQSQEQNRQNTESNSLTNSYESSYETSETKAIECSGEIEVPPSHSVQYSLIFNAFNVTLNTYTDLKLTLCSALINPDGNIDNNNNFIYIDNIPGVISHKETTTCQVQFTPAQYIRNDMTCYEEQRLSIADESNYIPKCNTNNGGNQYDGCQCSNGDDISVCWCVDELGNQLNGKAHQITDDMSNQQVCTQILQCSNTQYTYLSINKSVLTHHYHILRIIGIVTVILLLIIILYIGYMKRKKIGLNINIIKNWKYQRVSIPKEVEDEDEDEHEEDGINVGDQRANL